MSSRSSALRAVRTAILPRAAAKPGPSDRFISNTIRKLLLFLVAAVLLPAVMPEKATAQDVSRNDFSRHSVYAEGSLTGNVYSINYERRLTAHLGARTGVFFRTARANGVEVTVIPVMLNLLDGFHRLGRHRFELGTGSLFGVAHEALEDETTSGAIRGGFIVATGYRYQPLEQGILVRVGLTALNIAGDLDPSLHLSLGYTL